ncbi:hypothetical protein L6164_002112 [Bauhinia variegata]|uniref:Uncharacterized protein n=1 Tax=Bauhinia variegata TaxID=167791 RepID=A0ACB9PWN6_BAUVA|nr:hypothetical protein L6164_002112 [Bauhinia variegata]
MQLVTLPLIGIDIRDFLFALFAATLTPGIESRNQALSKTRQENTSIRSQPHYTAGGNLVLQWCHGIRMRRNSTKEVPMCHFMDFWAK